MSPLRIGVIGAGAWATTSHLPNLAGLGDVVEFVAVCRRGNAELKELKRVWGFTVASEDYRDVLAARVDLCVIATPAAYHYEHAAAALDSGAHVLLEKPVTVDPADAWDLVEKARTAKRHVVIAFGWNYNPIVVAAKRLMDDPGIGKIEHLTLQMGSATRELLSAGEAYIDASAPEVETWIDPELSGGGYGQAQLSHALGIALWLTGRSCAAGFAAMSPPSALPVELHDAAVLRLDNGATAAISGASLHVTPDQEPEQLRLQIVGHDGQLEVELDRSRIELLRPPDVPITKTFPPDTGRYECSGPVQAIVELALGIDRPNHSPPGLGARVVEALDVCYRSARSSREEQCAHANVDRPDEVPPA